MNATKLLTIALAGVLLVGGFGAVGAATPADDTHANDTVPEHVGDGPVTNETGAAGDRADAPGADATAEDRPGTVGPSDGFPGAVPDHVHAIHDRIESFFAGSIESLGGSLNEILSGGDTGSENGSVSE